jgi:hypothetical protein
MLIGRILTDGRMSARVKYDVTDNITMKINAQVFFLILKFMNGWNFFVFISAYGHARSFSVICEYRFDFLDSWIYPIELLTFSLFP